MRAELDPRSSSYRIIQGNAAAHKVSAPLVFVNYFYDLRSWRAEKSRNNEARRAVLLLFLRTRAVYMYIYIYIYIYKGEIMLRDHTLLTQQDLSWGLYGHARAVSVYTTLSNFASI